MLKKKTMSERQMEDRIAERKKLKSDAKASDKQKGEDKVGQSTIDKKKLQKDVAAASGGRSNYLQLQAGVNRVRFMMNISGYSFYVSRREVYLPVGGQSGKGASYVSPHTRDEHEYCPFSAISNALRKGCDSVSEGKKKQLTELSRRLWPRTTWYSNVLMYQNGKWDAGILQFPVTVFKGIAQQMLLASEDEEGDDIAGESNFAHPKYGVVVLIEKKGQGLKTEYSVVFKNKALPVTNEQLLARVPIEEFTAKITEADEAAVVLCEFFGYDDFDELLSDAADGSIKKLPDFTTGAVEQPNQKGGGAKPKKKTKDEEDDDYEDDEDDEDDDEDEKPVPKSKKKDKAKTKGKSAPDDSDEEDDEDEEEEDEDEDDETPPCFGSYGEPDKGFVCKTCPEKKNCKELSN